MALSATDLANDIKNDVIITENIPAGALPAFNNFAERLAIHITEQIKRGNVTTVQVSLEDGAQINEAPVE